MIQRVYTDSYASRKDYENSKSCGWSSYLGTYPDALMLATEDLQDEGIAVITVRAKNQPTVKLEHVTAKIDSSVSRPLPTWKELNNCKQLFTHERKTT